MKGTVNPLAKSPRWFKSINIHQIPIMELPVLYHSLKPYQRAKVREEYISRQKGLCWCCKHPLKEEPPQTIKNYPINKKLFPEHFFNYPIHLQHDHVNGLTEGAVHAYCNAVLWQYLGR